MYYSYDSIDYQTVFWDQDQNLITTIHENDGQWRGEYMNKLLNHFDIQVLRTDVIPKAVLDQL